MKDEWWNKKSKAVQDLAEKWKPTSFLHSPIKGGVWPTGLYCFNALLNNSGTTLLTDKEDILQRQQERIHDLLNRPSTTTPNALDNSLNHLMNLGSHQPFKK